MVTRRDGAIRISAAMVFRHRGRELDQKYIHGQVANGRMNLDDWTRWKKEWF